MEREAHHVREEEPRRRGHCFKKACCPKPRPTQSIIFIWLILILINFWSDSHKANSAALLTATNHKKDDETLHTSSSFYFYYDNKNIHGSRGSVNSDKTVLVQVPNFKTVGSPLPSYNNDSHNVIQPTSVNHDPSKNVITTAHKSRASLEDIYYEDTDDFYKDLVIDFDNEDPNEDSINANKFYNKAMIEGRNVPYIPSQTAPQSSHPSPKPPDNPFRFGMKMKTTHKPAKASKNWRTSKILRYKESSRSLKPQPPRQSVHLSNHCKRNATLAMRLVEANPHENQILFDYNKSVKRENVVMKPKVDPGRVSTPLSTGDASGSPTSILLTLTSPSVSLNSINTDLPEAPEQPIFQVVEAPEPVFTQAAEPQKPTGKDPSENSDMDDTRSIPGVPGVDYPVHMDIPATNFNCDEQRYKGFFADIESDCQAWHYCDFSDGKSSFLCPNGTLFSQVLLTCDWWFNVDCNQAKQLYVLNERLYRYIKAPKPSFPEDYQGPHVDNWLIKQLKLGKLPKIKKRRKKLPPHPLPHHPPPTLEESPVTQDLINSVLFF